MVVYNPHHGFYSMIEFEFVFTAAGEATHKLVSHHLPLFIITPLAFIHVSHKFWYQFCVRYYFSVMVRSDIYNNKTAD